jgi:hypothetical protein
MTSINVSQRTQMIVVDVASRSVSVINAGPVGPAGPTGEVSLAQLNTALDLKVAKAGDTMTGALTIPVTPTAVGHATSKQYVDTAISNAVTALLDGTPGALDTLNELAAALGDDANFAASVTTALSNKQPLDSDLTALAGLATTAWGRQVLTLADSAAALTYLGAGTAATKDVPSSGNASSSQVVKGDDTRLQAAADLTSHVALKNAHGVTRELYTFTSATPVHIPGNLLSHDQQRGINGWAAHNGSMSPVAGGADGGGATRLTTTTAGSQSYAVSDATAVGSVAPSESRTLSVRVYSPVSKTVQLMVWWTDAAGVFINAVVGDPVTVAAEITHTASFVATDAPALSSRLRAVVVLAPDQVLGGDTIDISVACLRTSPTIPGSSGVAGWGGNSDCIKVVAGEMVISKSGDSYGGAYMTELFVPPVSANHRRITTMIRYMGLPERELYIRSSWPYYADARHILLGGDKNLTLIHEITAGQTATAMIHEIAIFNSVAANGEQYILSPLNVEWSTYS